MLGLVGGKLTDDRGTAVIPSPPPPAVRIMIRPDVRTFFPSWPGFILKMFQPFLLNVTFYFKDKPSHCFLEFDGVPGASGPRMKNRTGPLLHGRPAGQSPLERALSEHGRRTFVGSGARVRRDAASRQCR